MTVRGFLISDDFEGTELPDSTLRVYERSFLDIARHESCQACHGKGYLQRGMRWPRNGFSEFPLDCGPGLARVVQSV